MKAVFLDFGTMGPGLDLSSLRSLLPELEFFDLSTANQASERIRDAEFVLANKMLITDALMQSSPALRFIGLTASVDINGNAFVRIAAAVSMNQQRLRPSDLRTLDALIRANS